MELDMEYNSQRDKMVIPEYGRNVQRLIEHAKTIEDKEKRQYFVDTLVRLMQQIAPSGKNTKEFKEKLWNHAFAIGNYELDVDPPDYVNIVVRSEAQKPEAMGYPQNEIQRRHYGLHLQQLIDKAVAEEDPQKRGQFANIIASYMKLAYKTWNPKHYVSDAMIKEDLKSVSNGTLEVEEGFALDKMYQSFTKQKRQFHANNHHSKGKSKKRKSKSNHKKKPRKKM